MFSLVKDIFNHLSGCCCMWKAAFPPSYPKLTSAKSTLLIKYFMPIFIRFGVVEVEYDYQSISEKKRIKPPIKVYTLKMFN